MQSTASDHAARGKYGYEFSWDGPYGHAVRLIETISPRRGLAVDLGCGYAAIAEPLIERGFEYVGLDLDAQSVSDVTKRGLEAYEFDLRRSEELAERIASIVGDRHLSAVFALDVIEHLADPNVFLVALRAALERHGRPCLIVSVPNVAHADLAAKLVFGRWDYTPTGLLDSTHLSFFTASRLHQETRSSGFVEVEARDVKLTTSDQHFPADHPAMQRDSPVAQLLRLWREAADEHGETVQFVRAFIPADIEDGPAPADTTAPARPLTVLMRTQGARVAGLREALTCLAAQTVDTFDVRLLVHTDDLSTVDAVRAVVDEFHASFASRVGIVHVPALGGRSRPLNVGLEAVQSDYVAFLDDDDLVTANWVQAFCENAGGCTVVRSQSSARYIRASTGGDAPYAIESGLRFNFDPTFDLARHLWMNQTPICSYAVPMSLVRRFALRFDEEFPVLEDWEFLLRLAELAPVRDTGKLTSVVQLWMTGDSSRSAHSKHLWESLERVLQERLEARPLILPPGSVSQLVEVHDRSAELEQLYDQALERAQQADRLEDELRQALGHFDDLSRRYQSVVQSKRWRVLGPPARALETVRRIRRRWRARQAVA